MPNFKARFAQASKEPVVHVATGALGVGGIILGAASVVGTTVATGGLALMGVGLGGLLLKAYRVLVPRRRGTATGIKLAEDAGTYAYWDCYFSKIAFLGVRGTGKTSLLEQYNSLAAPGEGSTTEKYYLVVRFFGNEHIFGFVGDGRGAEGDERRDQIDIAAEADILVFFVDHRDTRFHITDASNAALLKHLDKKRLADHACFIDYFIRLHHTKAVSILVLFNKKDLWLDGPCATHIHDWIATQTADLNTRYATLSTPIEIWPFSVYDGEDTLRLRRYLRDQTSNLTKNKEIPK